MQRDALLANDDLLTTRSEWHTAYLAGDIRRLSEIESPAFVVVSGDGIQDRMGQLAAIAEAVHRGRWFPPGSVTEDRQLVAMALQPDVMYLHGVGLIATPRGAGPLCAFTEIWMRAGQGWQVMHLHYHPIDGV